MRSRDLEPKRAEVGTALEQLNLLSEKLSIPYAVTAEAVSIFSRSLERGLEDQEAADSSHSLGALRRMQGGGHPNDPGRHGRRQQGAAERYRTLLQATGHGSSV